MLNQAKPKNVLGSGEMHTVREFLEETLNCADIKFKSQAQEVTKSTILSMTN